MSDEKFKIILTLLGGVIFAMIFILIALVMPVKKAPVSFDEYATPKSKLEHISKEARER